MAMVTIADLFEWFEHKILFEPASFRANIEHMHQFINLTWTSAVETSTPIPTHDNIIERQGIIWQTNQVERPQIVITMITTMITR